MEENQPQETVAEQPTTELTPEERISQLEEALSAKEQEARDN